MSKKCLTCNTLKDLKDFSKSKGCQDGFSNKCKPCTKAFREAKGTVSKELAVRYQRFLTYKEVTFRCKCCKEEKLANEFYTKRDYGKVVISASKCRQCQLDYQLFKTFGITRKQYNELLQSQDFSCAICNISEKDYAKQGYRNNFAVDHCHTTGAIRGLLCDQCNRGIGYLKDSTQILASAINYLSL